MKLVPRLKEKYIKEIVPTLCKNLSFTNKMQAPKLVKIVLNMGLGLDGTDNKILKSAEDDLSAIAGQKAQVTKSRNNVALPWCIISPSHNPSSGTSTIWISTSLFKL